MRRTAFVTALLTICTCCMPALAGPPRGGKGGPDPAAHADTVRAVHNRMKELKATCDKDPKAWQPRYELASLYLQFGLTSRAVKPLEEVMAIKPDHLPAYHLAGNVHHELKQYDKAIAVWKKALEISPTDQRPMTWIIQAQRSAKLDARLAEVTARLKADPTNVKTLLERARLQLDLGRWREALNDADLILGLDPNQAEALSVAATANYRLNQLDRAIRLLQLAVKADPANKVYQQRLTQITQVRKLRAELADVKRQLEEKPTDGRLYHRAGDLWMRFKRWETASGYLKNAVRLLPDDPAPRKSLAIALFRLGRMSEAVKEVEACVALDPKNAEYAQLLETFKKTQSMHAAMKQMGGKGAGDSNDKATP